MAKAFVNGITVHYQQKGAGRDVVLIHGITSCLAQWYVEILPNLAQDFRVTAYDIRGHGLSDMTPHGYTSRAMAADLLGLMDHLDVPRATLIGHSFGGAIALHLAMLHPERVEAVVLLDTGLACLRHLRVIREWSGWARWGTDLARFGITPEDFLDLDRQQDVTEILRRSLTVPVQSGFRKGQSALTPRVKKLLDDTSIGWEFRDVAGLTEERLTEITTPVLAVYGATSPYERMAEHLSRLLPCCRYEILDGAGHFYAVEEPRTTLDCISSFLTQLAADGTGDTRRTSPSA